MQIVWMVSDPEPIHTICVLFCQTGNVPVLSTQLVKPVNSVGDLGVVIDSQLPPLR